MEKLDNILKSYVAEGGETKGKLLGAAFIVVNKDGMRCFLSSLTVIRSCSGQGPYIRVRLVGQICW
jgi:hypothetical protein